MKHLKTVRNLRGQSTAGLRRRVRKNSDRIAELEQENSELSGANRALRNRLRSESRRPVPLPKGFTDILIDKHCQALAQVTAEKVVKENPELTGFSHKAGEFLAKYMRHGMRPDMQPSTEISYMYEDLMDGRNFRLSFCLRDVNIHYCDDLKMVQMMRFDSPGYNDPSATVPALPRPIEITDRDISASGVFSY